MSHLPAKSVAELEESTRSSQASASATATRRPRKACPGWIAAAALLGLGCLPIPHREYDAPAVSGQVSRDGKPSRAKILLDTSTGGSPLCATPRLEARSDASGTFQLERVGGWTPFLIFGDRLTTWTVCFEFPDGAQAHWRGSGWFGGPPRQTIVCRVNPVSTVNAIELSTAPPGSAPDNSCSVTNPDEANAGGSQAAAR